ncbi:MAG: MarR family winged helix-turn-helix transcriptional regulator [Solirubrobacterales bacterium]
MEAATKLSTHSVSAANRELALKLGAIMLRCFGGRGGDVLRVIDESGLTFIQMKALVTLEQPEEQAARTVTALSEELGISAASASRAADGLVRRRLASRVEDSEDRRVRRLTLTAKGRELANQIISARLAGIEDFMASLSPGEHQKLEAALDAIVKREDVAEIYRNHERRARR